MGLKPVANLSLSRVQLLMYEDPTLTNPFSPSHSSLDFPNCYSYEEIASEIKQLENHKQNEKLLLLK